MPKDPKTPPTLGLLSKVVKFVSSPTKDWRDLETHQVSSIDDPAAQQVRERIERKRRNDFIRATEFAQLRKVIHARRKQQQGKNGAINYSGLGRRKSTSVQASIGVPAKRSRSGTLQKIDEIEKQMSRQWWRGDENLTSTGDALDFTISAGQPNPTNETLDGAANSEFFLTGTSLFFAESVRAHFAEFKMQQVTSLHSEKLSDWGRKWLRLEQQAKDFGFEEIFVHEQDLEEASIFFASDRIEEAEKSLVSIIRGGGAGSASKEEVWLALFDLYRATARQDRFDSVALEYARIFNKSAPVWFSLPQLLGKELASSHLRPLSWVSPSELSLPAMRNLEALKGKSSEPYQLNWLRLTLIETQVLVPLTNFVNALADESCHVTFSGADNLLELLQLQTKVGDPTVDRQWWWLRLALLRLMGRQEDFEAVALDFTVTFEESPPSWRASKAVYENAQSQRGAAVKLDVASAADDAHLHKGQLRGNIRGDAQALLDASVEGLMPDDPVAIDCSALISIDFPAAGSVLNWAALQQSHGRLVAFINMHRLVAAFFHIIGINEHAKIMIRKN